MGALLAACGGGGSNITTTAPDAPIIGAATAGNAGASVAFTPPGSNGGSAITTYTATCTAAGAVRTGSATTSPIALTGLTNGITYSCSVTASNTVGTGAASAPVTVTPAASGGATSTASVLCSLATSVFNPSPSVNATSTSTWSCNSTARLLSANGLPDHAVGTFPNANNPNAITAQVVSASLSLAPVGPGTTTQVGGPTGSTGYVLNGVKIDPGTGGSCNDSGSTCTQLGNAGQWSMEALGQSSFNFGVDSNNAHVQPGGVYHYHGMPEGYITKLGKGTAMTLIGWAADGFPIYARYGYTVPTDASSAIKVVKGSYRLKLAPDANRPATSLYAMGAFRQDYEYVAGSGDLDECNGRTGVTPEFPAGIYHYYATDTYPFLQRCVKGKL